MKDYDYPSRAGFGIPEILEDPLPVLEIRGQHTYPAELLQ
jgi:hypothetical protein